MRLAALLILAGTVLAQPPETTSPLQSVDAMSELMLDVLYPTADQVFYAESANLLMAQNRAKDSDQWMKDAKLLWKVGNKAYTLAKKRDQAGLGALNDRLYEACQSCHVHYRQVIDGARRLR